MLNNIETLEAGFQKVSEETKLQCKEELEEIRLCLYMLNKFEFALVQTFQNNKEELANSLFDKSLIEVARLSGQMLFLIINGLYKNAYDTIRYIVESGIQSLYLDQNHPNSSIITKIEIWREVENSRDYHSQALIHKLELGELKGEKTKLESAYKSLSQKIHFGHKQVLCTIKDVMEHKGIPSKVDKNEIIQILVSFYSAFDIFLFLMIIRFPQAKEKLYENKALLELIRKKDFPILQKIFKDTP
jgi:hypothetical protein